jgi:predicted ATP-grasp superfamily ATP-dependent carboligase
VEHVIWSERPSLREPVLLCAFEGWNDAGDAASTAVRFLAEHWGARPFAEIDPEEFYDFTSTRPQVRLDDEGRREVVWPVNALSVVSAAELGRDVVLMLGAEPQLRWRTFCAQISGVADSLGASMVVTLGALLAEVAHTRPVSVVGTAYDPEVVERLGLTPSRYEGPTGIVGVLHDACRAAGLPSASLWAAVPSYVPGAPSPKAALALVEHIGALLDVAVPTTELEIASASYERQIDELVSADDETSSYVATLEERADNGEDDEPPSLIEEVERFLRDQGS